MSPFGNPRSLLAIATYLFPAFVLASPLAAPRTYAEGLSRRGNNGKIPCGNAPNIIAGNPVTAADVVVPNVDQGPPLATTDPSGYFPYVWCGAGTSTYVFIDPLISWGYNKGTNAPIFWAGLDGAYNATQNAMKSRAAQGQNPPTGDGSIDGPHETSLTWKVLIDHVVGSAAANAGISWVEVFAQDANHQKLTWGVYGAALTIMKDFVLSYPLYASPSYFQINDGKYGTLGNGYVGIAINHNTTTCYLENGVICGMPSDYPDN